MSEFFYGLKIKEGQCNAQCVKVCRQRTDLAMGEIRRRIAEGEYVLVLDAIEDSQPERKMKDFVKALADVGVEAWVCENDKPVSIEFLNNVEESSRDTGRFVAWEVAAELGEPVPEDYQDFEYDEDEEL